MTEHDAVLAVIDAIETLGLPHMLVGSLSSNAYGIPRSTQDADFVIELGSRSISEVQSRLPAGLQIDPQMTFETVTGTLRYLILLANSPFKIELFLVSKDPHDQQRFQRRIQQQAMGRTVWLPTAEDVVITKLRWSKQGHRTKDVDDVRNVLAVQESSLDWPYIHRWCDQHGTREVLDQVLRSIPKVRGWEQA